MATKVYLEKNLKQLENEARNVKDRLEFVEMQLRRQGQEMSDALQLARAEAAKVSMEKLGLSSELNSLERALRETAMNVQVMP